MVRQTLHMVGQGDHRILDYLTSCVEVWRREVDRHGGDIPTVDLQSIQAEIEGICGDWSLGKEVMVVSLMTALYDPEPGWPEGNKRIAAQTLTAILNSGCSVEVKHEAKTMAELYGIELPHSPGEMRDLAR